MKIRNIGALAMFTFSCAAFGQKLYEVRPAVGGGYDVYAPRGLEALREGSSLQIPRNLVTPAAPLDFSGLLNASQKAQQETYNAIRQREATENIREQNRLMQQRARMEAERYREDAEARRLAREADMA